MNINIDYGIDGRDIFHISFLSKLEDGGMMVLEVGILGAYFSIFTS